jgi:hypothetical protein
MHVTIEEKERDWYYYFVNAVFWQRGNEWTVR